MSIERIRTTEGEVAAGRRIGDVLMAWLEPGATPGWSRLAKKDGPWRRC
jgi:hypothetical protein